MDVYEFQIRGSKGDLYRVRAGSKGPGNLWMSCTCQAGLNGMYCYHRFGLLAGEAENVISADHDHISAVRALARGSDVEARMADILRLTEELEGAKARLSAAKKALARALLD